MPAASRPVGGAGGMLRGGDRAENGDGGDGAMIKSFSVEDFQPFAKATLELGRLRVLVGPNASGKTSLLRGLHSVCSAGHTVADQVFSDRLAGRHVVRQGREVARLALQTEFGGMDAELALAIGPYNRYPMDAEPGEVGLRSGCRIANQWYGLAAGQAVADQRTDRFWRSSGPPEGRSGNGREDPESVTLEEREKLRVFGSGISKCALLRFEGAKLAEPSFSEERDPVLEADGRGLGTAMATLLLREPDRFERLQDAARQIVRGLKGIRFDRESITRQVQESGKYPGSAQTVTQRVQGDLILVDTIATRGIPAHLVSEGTLFVLGLLAVILGPRPVRLILMDDIDRGLHPRAQAELIKVLRRLLERFPDLQIVATSHSPYLLDSLEYEEIWLTNVDDAGVASLAPLTAHPDVDRWRDEMAPGEFWSSVGESWLSGLPGSGD